MMKNVEEILTDNKSTLVLLLRIRIELWLWNQKLEVNLKNLLCYFFIKAQIWVYPNKN